MNLLIVGAGASRATSGLPMALDALRAWEGEIRRRYPLLAFALEVWVGNDWPRTDLERAWTRIDLAWTERVAGGGATAVPDLTEAQQEYVWEQAARAAGAEPPERAYYGSQTQGARDRGHSPEQFLSVVAGWELRRLIQETFVVPAADRARKLYGHLLDRVRPDAVISFNYDTLIEQCLPADAWTYDASELHAGRILVLKPHGSVNWTHRYPGADPGEEIAFGVTLAPPEMGYEAKGLVQNAVIGLRTKLEHTPAEGSPVVRSLFRRVLDRCEDVLAAADRIIVVGYRFAQADTGFLEVLGRAVSRRHRPAEVSVIGYRNREEMLLRLREVLALPPDQPIEHCFDGLEAWAEHGFHAGG